MNLTSIFSKIKTVLTGAAAGILVAAGTLFWASPTDGATKKADFTLVIDAGHGAHDTGAIDNGAKEKEINLGVAKKLEALVKKNMKNVNVVMTRHDDTFISLQERANIANRNKGNLFISIHTNSVDKKSPNRKTVKGASVYALGLHKDQNNLQVARRENSVIELESDYEQKYSGFDPNRDESYIIFEMAQKKNLGQSLKFADLAQKQLVKTAGRADRGVKQAGFWVLWATSMPAVLVELDFVCNPDIASFLNSENGQEKLATALYNAFEQYYASTSAASPKTNVTGKKSGRKTAETSSKSSDSHSQTVEESVAVVSESAEGTAVLQSNSSAPKKAVHVAKEQSSRSYPGTATGRKRRSANAKKSSDSRDVATESITLKSETDYLAATAPAKAEVKETVAVEKPSADSKKKKKKKEKKKKEKKGKVKDVKKETTKVTAPYENDKKSSKKSDKKSGKRVIKVSNPVVTAPAGTSGNSATSTAKGVAANPKYRIQICASEKELSTDSPRFCGLKPVEMFQENGYYKYTYGSSTNRREIQNMLMEVKTLIPDAFIIHR